jgi:anti-sigma regulatory factor (Ser/Thr protein kinase)
VEAAPPATAPLKLPALAEFAPAPPVLESNGPRPGPPAPRRQQETSDDAPGRHADWRLPAEAASIPVLRRRLRTLLHDAGVDHDQAYDLLLAACEAATNAFEHAQDPTEPFFDVAVHVDDHEVRISVRDYGQWRERMPSMDRGRGSTLMSAFGEITATPSPEGTTVVIVSLLTGDRSTSIIA